MSNAGFFPLLIAATVLYGASLASFALKKNNLCFAALVSGFVLHTAYQISRGMVAGMFLLNPVVQVVSLLPWALALVLIYKRFSAPGQETWESGMVLVVVAAIHAVLRPIETLPLGPNKLTIWDPLFFLCTTLALACFYTGGWFAILNLLKKNSRNGNSYHSLLVWGFILHSTGHITGGVWCFLGWAATYQWVPVHLQSVAIWLFFLNYLHLYYLPKWRRQAPVWYAALGFLFVLTLQISGYMA